MNLFESICQRIVKHPIKCNTAYGTAMVTFAPVADTANSVEVTAVAGDLATTFKASLQDDMEVIFAQVRRGLNADVTHTEIGSMFIKSPTLQVETVLGTASVTAQWHDGKMYVTCATDAGHEVTSWVDIRQPSDALFEQIKSDVFALGRELDQMNPLTVKTLLSGTAPRYIKTIAGNYFVSANWTGNKMSADVAIDKNVTLSLPTDPSELVSTFLRRLDDALAEFMSRLNTSLGEHLKLLDAQAASTVSLAAPDSKGATIGETYSSLGMYFLDTVAGQCVMTVRHDLDGHSRRIDAVVGDGDNKLSVSFPMNAKDSVQSLMERLDEEFTLKLASK